MTPILFSCISLLLMSSPAAAALPGATTGGASLRVHILEMESLQWRADLVEQLEYVGQGDCYTAWTADAETLKRLVAASASCRPAGTVKGLAAGGKRVAYVASWKRVATVVKGVTTSLANHPVIGQVLDGVELDVKGNPAPGGTLADITITNGRIRTFQMATQHAEIPSTLQIPDVFHETVNGRWLIPAGRAMVVAFHVHGQSTIPWSEDAFRDRVVVIDAGDVPAPTFFRAPRTRGDSWSPWISSIGWPTLLTGALAACFLAGWFVRGGTHPRTNRVTTAAEIGLTPQAEPVDADGHVGSPRPPRVSDTMVLIAATAVACLWVQTTLGTLTPAEVLEWISHPPATSQWHALNVALSLGGIVVILGAPLLVAGSGTIAMVVVSLPAAERSRALRKPGVLACVQVGFVAVLVAGLGLAQYLLSSGPDRVHEIAMTSSVCVTGLSGLGVAGCWMTMAMMGMWRPEATWTDRLGRLLGMSWIAILPFASLMLLLFVD